ncbi:MAG: hypothetical protein FWD52_03025 [Candidatus Bathyarchaeota archaeon]|nr:hypothetical protein [Candidatus Termiticorpusculum sp.]
MKKEKFILLSIILLLFCVSITICDINSVKASNKDNSGSLTVQILGSPGTASQASGSSVKEVLDVLEVPSHGAIVTSTIALQDKVSYEIVVSGVYYTGGTPIVNNAHDAMYATQNNWATHTNNQNGLYIDRWSIGSKQWGAYNPTHTYSCTIVGNGTQISFRIYGTDISTNTATDSSSNSSSDSTNSNDDLTNDPDTSPTSLANSPSTSPPPATTTPATEKSKGLFENTFVITTALIVTIIVAATLLLLTRSKKQAT